MPACLRLCVRVYVGVCECMWVYICINIHIHLCIHAHVYTCRYIYTYIHIYTYTYIYTYIYIYIYIYIYRSEWVKLALPQHFERAFAYVCVLTRATQLYEYTRTCTHMYAHTDLVPAFSSDDSLGYTRAQWHASCICET